MTSFRIFLAITVAVVITLSSMTGCDAADLDSYIDGKLSIFTQLYVRHTYGDPDLNEKNDIFGLAYNRWMFTSFNNSFRRSSYFGGYDLLAKTFCGRPKEFNLKGHIYIGLLYGYGNSSILSHSGYRIVAAPTIEIGIYKGIAIEGIYVPDKSWGTVISVVKYNF